MTSPFYIPGQTPDYDPTDMGNRPNDGPYRVGGIALRSVPQTSENLPSTQSKCVQNQARGLALCRDVAAGCERIRDKQTDYLPKAPGEDAENYKDRLRRSVFFEFFMRTVDGMVGMVFRRDPILGDDVPPQIRDDWENIDNAGTHGDVYCRELLADAITAGHAAILVEYPDTNGQRLTLADELPLRPYWVMVRKDDIMSWRTAVIDGKTVLTQIVIRECQMVPNGTFGETEQVRYRVLYRDASQTTPVGFKLLQINDDKSVAVLKQGVYNNQDEIPIAEIVTSGRKSIFESRPQLEGVAYLNVAHYQQWSDYATSMYKAGVPIFVTIGAQVRDDTDRPLVIGPNSGVSLPSGADAKYVSHDGAALNSQKQALDDLKNDIATMGLSQLAPQKRLAETALSKRIDKSTSDSALAVTARGLQDGIERALHFHAKYRKLESGGSIVINRDFENLTMTAQEIDALSQLVVRGQLTVETLWDRLAEGNVMPEDFNAEEEKAALDAETELQRVNARADAALAAQKAAAASGLPNTVSDNPPPAVPAPAALANPDVGIPNRDGLPARR